MALLILALGEPGFDAALGLDHGDGRRDPLHEHERGEAGGGPGEEDEERPLEGTAPERAAIEAGVEAASRAAGFAGGGARFTAA
ncbi:MAG: hypothetical protein IPJ98_19925 [Bryobacterales bacterium]|nr:hypothetical protein [Bryobacterales bacterium]